MLESILELPLIFGAVWFLATLAVDDEALPQLSMMSLGFIVLLLAVALSTLVSMPTAAMKAKTALNLFAQITLGLAPLFVKSGSKDLI